MPLARKYVPCSSPFSELLDVYNLFLKAADIFKAERKMSASRKAKCTPI